MYKVLMLVLLPAVLLTGKKVGMVNMQQLQESVKKTNDTLYVVNFWATWCKPCVKEMPYFEVSGQKFKSNKVKVLFVSLNSPKELEQVESFVNQKEVKADVELLNSGNPNSWIDVVDSSWSGAIPATAIYRRGKKVTFREGEFTQTELDSIIKKQIQ